MAVALPDGPEAAATLISVAAAAVCVPLGPSSAADELQRYFAELQVAALITTADVDSASRGVALARGIPVIDFSTPARGGRGRLQPSTESTRIKVDGFATCTDDAFMLLTSGSTSRPKIVPLTHASVCLSAHNVGAAIAIEYHDRLLSVLPLFHGHGLISGVIATLAAGSSVVCTPGFDAAAFFDWLTEKFG